MFSIRLSFDDNWLLTGLEALDKRRALGLADVCRLEMKDDHWVGTDVDEGFARAYFPSSAYRVTRTVPMKLLAKGDVVDKPGINDPHFCTPADLTPERIKQLWLASPAEGQEIN